MGLFSALFGSGSETQRTVSTGDAATQANLDLANRLASQAFGGGFTPFAGEGVAGFSPDQLKAFEMARGFAAPDPNDPRSQLVNQAYQRFLGGPAEGDIDAYMNPFISRVMDTARDRNRDTYLQNLNKVRSSADFQSAYGGSRLGVAESQMADDFIRRQSELEANMLMQGFDRALDNVYKTGTEGFNLAQAGYGRDMDRINVLGAAGGQQQGLDQRKLDFDYNEFMRSVNEPKQDALALGDFTYKNPYSQTTDVTKSTPSLFDAIAGVAGLGLGIAGGFGLGGGGGSGGGGGISLPIGGSGGGGAASPMHSNPFMTPNSMSALTMPINPTATGGQFTPYYQQAPTSRQVQSGYKDGGRVRKEYKNPFVKGYARGGIVESMKTDIMFPELRQGPSINDMAQDLYSLRPGPSIEEMSPRALRPGPSIREFMEQYGQRAKTSPAPSLKPERSTPDTGSIRDLFQQPTGSDKKLKEEERNWLDRWVDNPLTELGLTLLSGTDTAFGKMAGGLLDNRRAELAEEQRQAELEQAQQIEAEQQKYTRTQDAAMMDLRNRQLAETISNNKRRAKADDERVRAAMVTAKSAEKRNRLDELRGRLGQIDKSIQDLISEQQDIMISPELKEVIMEKVTKLENERENLMRSFDAEANVAATRVYNPETGDFE